MISMWQLWKMSSLEMNWEKQFSHCLQSLILDSKYLKHCIITVQLYCLDIFMWIMKEECDANHQFTCLFPCTYIRVNIDFIYKYDSVIMINLNL